MNRLLQQLILENLKRTTGTRADSTSLSRYDYARGYHHLKVSTGQLLKGVLLVSIGIFSAGFGLESFLLPNGFIDGGVTGISLLVAQVTGLPLPLLILAINIPFMVLGFTQVGRPFALRSVISITGLSIAISVINYPFVTSDHLLVSVFGGFFVGAGIGFAVRGGAVLDGTEVVAIYLTRRSGLSIGDIVLLFNILIFSVAAYLLSIETALYSILTYLAASKTVDFIIEGIEEYTGVTIISSHSEEIREMIVEKMKRGVTIYYGRRGLARNSSKADTDIVFTVITRLEVAKLRNEVDRIDSHAFMVLSAIKETHGGLLKKRPMADTH
jgi:uncharacterized membrane-anchored protein YitT (DUF2179 family)